MCIHCAQNETNLAIGIDVGTSGTRVAVWADNRIDTIPINVQRSLPSSIAFCESGERLVGNAAHIDFSPQVRQVVRYVTRLLASTEFPTAAHWPVQQHDHKVQVVYGDGEVQHYTAEQLVSIILTAVKAAAEFYLGATSTHVVLTVPTCYGAEQKQAMLQASHRSGFNEVQLLDDAVAVSIAYGLESHNLHELHNTTLIVDLGSGYLDVALLRLEKNQGATVRATAGLTLGGIDWDHRLAGYCWEMFVHQHGITTETTGEPSLAVQSRLLLACETARCTLSSQPRTTIDLPALEHRKDLHVTLPRTQFEELTHDLFQRTLQPIHQVLSRAQVNPGQVQEVFLVGGATRMPALQHLLAREFPGCKVEVSEEQDEQVVYGAAVQAAILEGVASNLVHPLSSEAVHAKAHHCDGGHHHDHRHEHTDLHPKAREIHI